MASINDSKRLVKRIYLTNLITPKGLSLTGLLTGQHGIGKTQIVHAAARELGGSALVVEGGTLKEGEITGLPFASPTAEGGTEVRFVPYYQVSNIQQLEKEYYRKATNEGFLDGAVKFNSENNVVAVTRTKGTQEISVGDKLERILKGEINNYAFGSELPVDVKIKLIESGEIRPVILFIDELNRTESQTMKELMNIVLNRNINGYDLPWWVTVISAVNPSSQNSVYATNELDDAQKDRFLKVSVIPKLDEWVDYGLSSGMNSEIVAAVATSDDIFMRREKGYQDTDEQNPSPRSWEMVSYIYDSIGMFNNSSLLTREDIKHQEEDLRALINGKVGATAGRTLLQALNDKENNIKPEEILNGKTDAVSEEVKQKFANLKFYRRKIIADNVIKYIARTIADFEKKKASGDAEGKKAYLNYKEQLKDFIRMLDDATTIAFAKKMSQVDQVVAEDGKNVFSKVSDCFVKEVLEQLIEFETGKKALEKDE